MTDIAGVILAGGQARRMGGGDKCLLELGGEPVLTHVINRIAPQVGKLAINANGDPARFSEFGLPVIADTFGGFAGPLAGVLAAMGWAEKSGADWVATVAADTPFFPTDLVAGLRGSLSDGGEISLAVTPDAERGPVRQPTFGLWPVGLRTDLQAALEGGTRKVVMWTDRHETRTAVFGGGGQDPFFNINTPQDLEMAQASVVGHS